MLGRSVFAGPAFIPRRWAPVLLSRIVLLLTFATPLAAQSELPKVTVGAGLQSSFAHTNPDSGPSTDQFLLNSARIYVNGSAAENVKFTFNTEFDGGTNKIGVLDAIGRLEYNPKFNIWAGRFLPPSDRANLYGPYYAHHWASFTDSVQDGYPTVATGRANGVAYWGDFGRVKVSGGGFDGATSDHKPDVIGAARLQVDFWDKEPGYYLNGTYYGGKNVLAIGGAGMVQDKNTASNVDFLMERKLPDGSVFTIESEYANYHKLGGWDANYGTSQGAYLLAAYLFPKGPGPGKFEVLGKYAKAQFTRGLTVADTNYNQKTSEFNLNYVLKDFNARVMFFIRKNDYNTVKTDYWQTGVGLQLQM
jgi:hypothetical protein